MDVLRYGIENERVFDQHKSLATVFTPLHRGIFASADEFGIRIWDGEREKKKLFFPRMSRSIVCSLLWMPNWKVLLVGEQDHSLKVYSEDLQLLDTIKTQDKWLYLACVDKFLLACGKRSQSAFVFSRKAKLGSFDMHYQIEDPSHETDFKTSDTEAQGDIRGGRGG